MEPSLSDGLDNVAPTAVSEELSDTDSETLDVPSEPELIVSEQVSTSPEEEPLLFHTDSMSDVVNDPLEVAPALDFPGEPSDGELTSPEEEPSIDSPLSPEAESTGDDVSDIPVEVTSASEEEELIATASAAVPEAVGKFFDD